MSTYIIAEAGVNHNGDINLAYQMIDKAVEAGVDCVKFQTFKASHLVSKNAAMANYQKLNMNSDEKQVEMLKRVELKFDDFIRLKAYADAKGIAFCSTAFDEESVDFLNTLHMPFFKIPSGEVTNLPLITKLAKYNRPMIMSTGMCEMNEIADILKIIRKYNKQRIVLLHCNTEYPTPAADVNLRAMQTLKSVFKTAVGYSDHTLGIEVPLAAAALGACVIEKHFTLDKHMIGPDHAASLDPQEMASMVKGIRTIEKALGSCEKRVTESERKNMTAARKSIVAKRKIKKGEILSSANLTTKRPGSGISPMLWDQVIGSAARKDYEEDEQIIL